MLKRTPGMRGKSTILFALLLSLLMFEGNTKGVVQSEFSRSRALGLSWKGYVDTDLDFSEFFESDFTILVRFMSQFPNAYEGPLIAENGHGRFFIGQGDFLSGVWGTKLLLAVGSQEQTYDVFVGGGAWHTLVVVGHNAGAYREYTPYFRGMRLGRPLRVSQTDPQLPTGTLRFGKRTTGQPVNAHDAQFYGFLDDVAVFNYALSDFEITNLQSLRYELADWVPGLVAGYKFDIGSPFLTQRPVALKGSAQLLAVTEDRQATYDVLRLPLPTQQAEYTLPFAPGEAWYVVQGFDEAAGSHKGYASFCWDFILADFPHTGLYPFGTNGAPLYAATSGRVITVGQQINNPDPPSLVEIEHAPGESYGYLHIRKDSASVGIGGSVVRGQLVALAGDTGAGPGNYHLHFGVSDKPDRTFGFVTFPVAFSNYETRDSNGVWHRVARGIPRAGEVIRSIASPIQ